MPQIVMALPPPRLWQQFQELTRDTANYVFNTTDATEYGNQGAPQHGVDIYLHESGTGRLIAIQCKRSGKITAEGKSLPGGLKPEDLAQEVEKAKEFDVDLKQYIVATTDTRQVPIQDEQRRLDGEQRRRGSFSVQVWFWDDFLGYLHRYSKLLEWYYANILEMKGVYSVDHQVLYLLQMAFSRPAFTTPITGEESGPGFFEALENTETAINLGQLRDRKTGGLVRVAPGGSALISNADWRSAIGGVLELVQAARAEYKAAVDNQIIVEAQHGIFVTDGSVAQKLNCLRGDAIRNLNEVLREAGLPEVVSPL